MAKEELEDSSLECTGVLLENLERQLMQGPDDRRSFVLFSREIFRERFGSTRP